MAIDKTLKEFEIGVDAGWLMALDTLKKFSQTNPSASISDAMSFVEAAHKPSVTLAQILANEGV
jgi:hypothetical protein